MRSLPLIAERQSGVFSAKQAMSEGWTQDALRWAVRRGDLVRLRAAAFQVSDLGYLSKYDQARWRHAAPAVAAALTTPGAMASHSTAAILRNLPLAFVPGRSCVSVVPWHTGEIRRIHVHRTTSAEFSLPVSFVAEVSCHTAARAIVDLAREHGVPAAVVPLDYALRFGLTSEDEMLRTLAHCRGWPGVRAARTAIAAADPRSESPLESRSRLKLTDHGIAPPEPQSRIGDEYGNFIARVDFYWDEFGVVGEVDGSIKYDESKPSSLVDEKWRQEQLERTDLIVVRWGAADLRRFDAMADRLRRAFAKGRSRPATDRRWSVLPATSRFDPAIGVIGH